VPRTTVLGKGGVMSDRILVAYASKHGSTREVAEAVARRLEEHDLDVELRAAATVDDLVAYDGVVLGAALYMGRMVGGAREFLRRHHAELAERPFGIYAMGPLTTSHDDVEGAMKQLEAGLAKAPDIHPITKAIFGGVVDPAQLRFPFNRMHASDARDWNAIDVWADGVAAAVRSALVAPS